jgi:hypothetical protein
MNEVIMTYKEKLLNPKWQKKRLEIFQRDNYACQCCGDKENTLNVHHRRYLKVESPWDYPDNLLVTLCVSCHEEETNFMQQYIEVIIEQLRDKFFSGDVLDLAAAINGIDTKINSKKVINAIFYLLRNEKEIIKLSNKYDGFVRKIKNG